MLKFVSDHLKTKKMSKHVVKKLSYLWRYLPDQYATQRIGDKAILENGRTLKSLPDCYKNQEMRNKAVDNYPHGLKFALEREWSKVSKSEKKCAMKLSILILLQYNLFLNALWLKKCLIKQ